MKVFRILTIGIAFVILAFFSNFSQKSKKGLDKEAVISEIKNTRIPFVKNESQFDKRVSYYAKTFAGTLFVTKDGVLVYDLPKVEKTEKEGAKDKANFKELNHKITGGVVIKERLLGAEVKEVKGIGKSETKVSYFKGNDPKNWKSDIETYGSVSLGEVYEGIKVELKAKGNN